MSPRVLNGTWDRGNALSRMAIGTLVERRVWSQFLKAYSKDEGCQSREDHFLPCASPGFHPQHHPNVKQISKVINCMYRDKGMDRDFLFLSYFSGLPQRALNAQNRFIYPSGRMSTLLCECSLQNLKRSCWGVQVQVPACTCPDLVIFIPHQFPGNRSLALSCLLKSEESQGPLCVCVCVHVYMHVCVWVCGGVVHRCWLLMVGVFFSHSPPCVLRQVLSRNLELTDWLDWLAREPQGTSHLCLQDSRHNFCTWLFPWVLDIKVRSSCLLGKHFTDWTVSPSPQELLRLISLDT